MKKIYLLKTLLLTAAVLMGVCSTWAQSTVTFDATTDVTETAQSYQSTEKSYTASDGSVWKANGYGATAYTSLVIGKGGANYLETPLVNGTITSVAVTWSGNDSYYLALQTTTGTELDAKKNPSTSTTESFTVSGAYSQLRLVGRRNSGTSNAAATITKVVVTYTPGSVNIETVATPTFSPAAGEVYAGTKVSISCSTSGATIYYTTDGTTPSTGSPVYSAPIEITGETTIKAFASKANYNDSEVATAAYTVKQVVEITGYTIDFESDLDSYVYWNFVNIGNTYTASNFTAYRGSKYGANINENGNGVTTASIQTKEKVALPGTLTCYVSKTSTNTTSSTWYISVSTDGSSWTNVKTQSGISMDKGEWVEFTADLSTYSNVYVRISYNSTSTAVRAIDDITLTERDPNAKEVKYYLVGSFDADPWIDHKVEMTRSGSTYSVDKNLTNGTMFKILKIDETNNDETTWYGGSANGDYYGVNSNVCTDIALIPGDNGKNFKIDGSCDGTFTFTVDVTDADAPTLTVIGWHVPEVKYYLAGNWGENESGWTTAKVELTENADGKFNCSKLVGDGTRFKFVKTVDGVESWLSANKTGDDYEIHSAHCTDIQLVENSNNSAFVIGIADDATLSFTLDPTTMTFDVAGWPITAEGNLFQKVTSTADLTDGAYLIVYEDGNVAFNGGLEILDANGNTISVTITNNAIAADATTKAALFLIQGGTIKSASGFYIGNTSDNNGLSASDETAYTNTISIDEDGNAVIISSGGAYLRFNSATNNGNRFRYYKSSSYDAQKAIQLYKLVTIENVSVTITEAEYATFHSELDVDFSGTDVTVYTATDNGTSVKLTEVESGKVPANTPVVLYKAGGGNVSVPVIAEADDITEPNDLQIVDEENFTGDNDVYVLAMPSDKPVGFYLWDSSVVLNVGKVYLQSVTGEGEARQFLPFDEATGISETISVKNDSNVTYDLQGRRVVKAQKGLYIMNGKKVIMK